MVQSEKDLKIFDIKIQEEGVIYFTNTFMYYVLSYSSHLHFQKHDFNITNPMINIIVAAVFLFILPFATKGSTGDQKILKSPGQKQLVK